MSQSHVNELDRDQLAIMIRAVQYITPDLLDAYMEWASGGRFFYGSSSEEVITYWNRVIVANER